MKKLLVGSLTMATVVFSLMVNAASTSSGAEATTEAKANTGFAAKMVKKAVDKQCRSTIASNTIFKKTSATLNEGDQNKLEDQVCGCVSDKSSEKITTSELSKAAFDKTARTALVTEVVSKTLSACVTEVLG